MNDPSRLSFSLDTRLLSELAPPRPFWKGRLIGVQGNPCDSLHIVAEGLVLLSRCDREGEDQGLYLLGPGQLFGEGSLHPECRWLVTARAVTDGIANVLPAAQLPRLCQYYPQLAAHVLTLLTLRLERAHRRLDVTGTHSAKDRLLGLLSVMADYHGEREGEEVWLPLGITQTELGDMIGLARETVARLLADLEEEGTIRRDGRRGLWLRAADLDGNLFFG